MDDALGVVARVHGRAIAQGNAHVRHGARGIAVRVSPEEDADEARGNGQLERGFKRPGRRAPLAWTRPRAGVTSALARARRTSCAQS
ncbi:MAG: hypothetical protein ACOX62_03415 [Christensenellales bacterium]